MKCPATNVGELFDHQSALIAACQERVAWLYVESISSDRFCIETSFVKFDVRV